MGKVIGIDYGKKRVGIAMTDELQIIASGLTTVEEKEAINYLTKVIAQNNIETIVIGEPRNLDNTEAEMTRYARAFGDKVMAAFPAIMVRFIDERFTSKIASRTMFDSGLKKKDRQNKSLLDEISATLILQAFLEKKAFKV